MFPGLKPKICWFFFLINICSLLIAQPDDQYQKREDDFLTLFQKKGINIASLKICPKLKLSAQYYAEVLAKKGILQHKDTSSRRALERYQEQGGTALQVGEVLAWAKDLDQAIDGWQKSPSHYKIISNLKWTHCALGRAKYKNAYVYVLLFTIIKFDIDIINKEDEIKLKIKKIEDDPGQIYLGNIAKEISPLKIDKKEALYSISKKRLPCLLQIGIKKDSGEVRFYQSILLKID